jgi:DNA-binding transcriptional regulator YdaS (Cro superfamily)
MDLKTYIADDSRKTALAQAVGKSPAYLWQVATGWKGKRASPELAQAIEASTAGEVRCDGVDGIRPDLQWMRGADGQITGYFVPAEKVA